MNQFWDEINAMGVMQHEEGSIADDTMVGDREDETASSADDDDSVINYDPQEPAEVNESPEATVENTAAEELPTPQEPLIVPEKPPPTEIEVSCRPRHPHQG